jgi:hypothetical protein
MTLDERLEALVTSTELMSGMLKHMLANMDKLSTTMEKLGVTMNTLAQVVINHENRLKRLARLSQN